MLSIRSKSARVVVLVSGLLLLVKISTAQEINESVSGEPEIATLPSKNGVGSAGNDRKESGPMGKKETPEQKEARVHTGQLFWESSYCKEEHELGGVLGIIVVSALPKLIDFGIDLLSEKLSEKADSYKVVHTGQIADVWGTVRIDGLPVVAGEEKKNIKSPAAEIQFTEVRRCLVFYGGQAGKWGRKEKRGQIKISAASDKKFYTSSVISGDERPSIYFTADIIVQAMGKKGYVFKFEPYRFVLNAATSSGKKSKDIVITAKFDVPEIITGDTYSVEAVLPPFRAVNIGNKLEIQGISSSWLPFPTPSVSQELIGFDVPIPVTVVLSITETDTGNGDRLFRVFSEAIAEKKDEIRKEIIGQILPKEEESTEKSDVASGGD